MTALNCTNPTSKMLFFFHSKSYMIFFFPKQKGFNHFFVIIEIKVRFRIWCRKSILNIGSLCILCRSSAKKPHGVITQKSAKRQSFSPQRNDRRANQPLNLEWFVQVLNTSSKNMLSSLVCVFSTWLKKKKKDIFNISL